MREPRPIARAPVRTSHFPSQLGVQNSNGQCPVVCSPSAARRGAPCGRGSAALAGPTDMGKIIRGPEAWSQVKLSTRRVGGGGACSEEFAAYLTCLDKKQANEEECKTLREALRRCMYVASSGARTSRHVVPINYHLQKVRRSIA